MRIWCWAYARSSSGNGRTPARAFGQAAQAPVNDLTGTLLSAWAAYGAGDVRGGVDTIDKLSGPEWYALFKDMHAGLMLDLANNKKDARKRLEKAFKLDASALRIMQAYAGFLSRNGDTGRGAENLRSVRSSNCRAIR